MRRFSKRDMGATSVAEILAVVGICEIYWGQGGGVGHDVVTLCWPQVGWSPMWSYFRLYFFQKWKPVQNAGGTVWCLLWGKFWSQFVHRLCGPMSACPMLTRCENHSKKKKSDGCPCVTVSWSPMWSHVGHSLSATACSPLDCCSREARSVTRLLCNSYNSSMVEPGWLNPHAHFPLLLSGGSPLYFCISGAFLYLLLLSRFNHQACHCPKTTEFVIYSEHYVCLYVYFPS